MDDRGRDELFKLNVPQSSIGAPLPHVVSSELSLVLAYLIEDTSEAWDGTSVRVVDEDSPDPAVVVRFDSPYAWTMGPPNDEAIAGHPLADRGLDSYSAYRVEGSSWIKELCRRNSVHPHHRSEPFDLLDHYIFVFHDSTFECAARGYSIESAEGPMRSLIQSLAE